MVNNVARAIAVALDWSSSPDDRKAAYSYLESVRREIKRNNFFLFLKICIFYVYEWLLENLF